MNKIIENQKHYRTGFYEDCIENHDFFDECSYKFLNNDKKYFKWIILSLFTFLQELFILALRNGNTQNIMSEKNKKHALSFEDLFKNVKKTETMNHFINSKCLEDKSGKITSSINKLKELRDNFIHLKVDSWSIECNLFFEIVPDCLSVAIFLIEESNNISDYNGLLTENVLPRLKTLKEYLNSK